MNAALKVVVAFCEAGDLELAALQDARAGHRNVLKTAGTFGNGCFARIEFGNKAATEVFDLGEGVKFATLIDYEYRRSFLDVENVR